jgi:pimeloyl-ACP methyl ester carboxylesterase
MVTLPTTEWGAVDAERRALLIHGINGSGATWWRVGEALAADGWHVTAVDLRGHGDADRADGYSIEQYVSDLPGTDWNLVVGHSLGAAIGTVAAARPGFARSLVLLDPVLLVPADEVEAVRADQVSELGDSLDDIRLSRSHWDPRDQQAKFDAARRADRGMVDATFAQNQPWDLVATAQSLEVETLVIGADPAVFTFFPPELAARITTANPLVRYVVVPGAGHSPHKDEPDQTIALLREFTSAGGPLP